MLLTLDVGRVCLQRMHLAEGEPDLLICAVFLVALIGHDMRLIYEDYCFLCLFLIKNSKRVRLLLSKRIRAVQLFPLLWSKLKKIILAIGGEWSETKQDATLEGLIAKDTTTVVSSPKNTSLQVYSLESQVAQARCASVCTMLSCTQQSKWNDLYGEKRLCSKTWKY